MNTENPSMPTAPARVEKGPRSVSCTSRHTGTDAPMAATPTRHVNTV
jgi:hypothetical protein